MKHRLGAYWDGLEDGRQRLKDELLRAIDNIECSELGDEEGGEYILGPDFRPPSKHNIDALRTWIESFKV